MCLPLLCAACRALTYFVNNNIKHVCGLAAFSTCASIYYNNNSVFIQIFEILRSIHENGFYPDIQKLRVFLVTLIVSLKS